MRFKKMIIGLVLIVVGVVIDQVTKVIAFKVFEPRTEYKSIPGFKIILVENPGAAWGVFANKMWLLILVTLVAFGFFAYLMKDFDLKNNSIYSASLILMISGTIGNFIDRIFLGHVRDFVTFSFLNNFPSFNFADMCLTIGVIFLSIDILFGETGVRWTK
jgi:signal peptidase II